MAGYYTALHKIRETRIIILAKTPNKIYIIIRKIYIIIEKGIFITFNLMTLKIYYTIY